MSIRRRFGFRHGYFFPPYRQKQFHLLQPARAEAEGGDHNSAEVQVMIF